MQELLRYVPDDRILCETDSPYLAPVPMRGTTDCPLYVEHTYAYIAKARGIEPQALCELVDKNILNLFFNQKKQILKDFFYRIQNGSLILIPEENESPAAIHSLKVIFPSPGAGM